MNFLGASRWGSNKNRLLREIVCASRSPPRPLGGLEAWRLGGEEAQRGLERLRKTSEVPWIFGGFSWYGGVKIRGKINKNCAWGGLGEVLGGRKSLLEVFWGDLGCILGVLRVPCRRIGRFRGDLGGSWEDLGGSLDSLLGGFWRVRG